jgi:hypothetical protein
MCLNETAMALLQVHKAEHVIWPTLTLSGHSIKQGDLAEDVSKMLCSRLGSELNNRKKKILRSWGYVRLGWDWLSLSGLGGSWGARVKFLLYISSSLVSARLHTEA